MFMFMGVFMLMLMLVVVFVLVFVLVGHGLTLPSVPSGNTASVPVRRLRTQFFRQIG
jgi:hypothetical protein